MLNPTTTMGESAKSQVGEKVAVAVISAIILAALAYVARNFLLPLLSTGWGKTKAIAAWFFSGSVASPAWLFCILCFAALILILVLFVAFVRKFSSAEKINLPSWTDYTEDNFFGMKWRWRYTNSNRIGSLWCYCPNDDTSLVYSRDYIEEPSARLMSQGVGFRCETCNEKFGPFPGTKENVCERVERQIDRKVRSNEWQKIISPILAKA